MMEPLPVGSFSWIEDVDKFDVSKMTENAEIRYILETTLEYPENLHDVHSDYPLALERRSVADSESDFEMLTASVRSG